MRDEMMRRLQTHGQKRDEVKKQSLPASRKPGPFLSSKSDGSHTHMQNPMGGDTSVISLPLRGKKDAADEEMRAH
jgi:hypothetical protein